MEWFDCFDFFLFDFDGLLVNTEKLHYQAYQQLVKKRGFVLDWSFDQFCGLAHLNAHALKDSICQQFPSLKAIPWEVLYSEKKALYLEILNATDSISLMPGVEELLKKLKAKSKKSCVVTNSLKEQIDLIRKKIPLLENIPYWVTREDYDQAKPAPDGYLKAISLYGVKKEGEERVIGFEDSLRGLKALQMTKAAPVLICSAKHPQMKNLDQNILHVESFFELNQKLSSTPLLKKGL